MDNQLYLVSKLSYLLKLLASVMSLSVVYIRHWENVQVIENCDKLEECAEMASVPNRAYLLFNNHIRTKL